MQDSQAADANRQRAKIVFLIALGWGLFQVWAAFSGGLPELMQRAVHLGAALVLAIAIYPALFGRGDWRQWRGSMTAFVVGGIAGTLLLGIVFEAAKLYLRVPLPSLPVFAWLVIGIAVALGLYLPAKGMAARNFMAPVDIVLEILAISITLYTIANYERIMLLTATGTPIDYLMALSLLFLILEMGRRVVGWALPILVGLLIIYTLFGHYIPGMFGHPPMAVKTVLYSMFLQPSTSLYGYIVGLSAVLIAILVIFGGILVVTGCGNGFMDIALALVGKRRGGPAQVSVISSALFGTISGSAVANVAVTGNFTIPLMKRVGYEPAFAAGTEATASTGGQIVPPIMGLAAFIMAELLGVSYFKIVLAAIIPAFIYYFACFLSVDLYAAKGKLRPVPNEYFLPLRVALSRWRVLTPVVVAMVILVVMLIRGYPVEYCIFWAVAGTVTTHVLVGSGSFWRRGMDIINGVENGARTLITVALIVGLAQSLVSLIDVSGVAPKLTMLITSIGGGNLLLALITAALAVIALGMGMPTVAVYVVGVGVILPGLVGLGLQPLVAHFFIFWYGVVAAITPPLCAAVFVAAPLAGCRWTRAAWWALRLGFSGLIVPMVFAYRPGLLLIGGPVDILSAAVATIGGVVGWTCAIAGHLSRSLNKWERIAFFSGGSLLIFPGITTDIAGAAVVIGTYLWQRFTARTVPVSGTGP